ncbi:phosphate metabolism protein 7 [Coemansia sp. Cherry 401B]|nr:phosphate metabolism protein 7 [Coemansia sp. Cherry 401B]
MDSIFNITGHLAPSQDDDTQDTSSSIRTFVSSLVLNASVALLIFLAFSLLRPRFRRVYAPRTYAINKSKRPLPVGNGLFSWIPAALRVPDTEIIKKSGLDTYLFLRSIRTKFIVFSVLSLASAASIVPVNVRGTMGQRGLNSLSMGNVDAKSDWLWAHVALFALAVAWTMRALIGELRVYMGLRMWWLTHPQTARRPGAAVVLVSDVPADMSDKQLENLFEVFPGGVGQVFVNRTSRRLKKLVERRDKLAKRLERELTGFAVKCTRAGQLLARPQTRAAKSMFKPCDVFEQCADALAECNEQIARSAQNRTGELERQSTALVRFRRQIAAHMAAQTTLDSRPFRLGRVTTDVDPEDVIWANLEISCWSRRIRGYASFVATLALTVTWTAISAVLSTLVQVESLAQLDRFAWLRGHSLLLGLFSGAVPSLVMALLMAVMPRLLRALLYLEGTPRRSEIRLRLLHRYFWFQVWNVYLVTIFSTSVFQIAVQSLGRPAQIFELVQTQVPQSATSILTYVLLLSFVGAAKEILQGVPLALRYLKPLLLAKSPRELQRAERPGEFKWESAIPTHSVIFLMGFSYAVLQPVVSWFAAVYFGLFYVIYRYQFVYVYNDRAWSVHGVSFPRAVQQMVAGVYVSELFMLAMMVAKLQRSASAILRVVAVALVLVLTVVVHLYINDEYMRSDHLSVRRAADVDANPQMATEFPSLLDNDDSASGLASDELRAHNRVFATYRSLVPDIVLRWVLRAVTLTPEARDGDWMDSEEELAGGHDGDVDLARQFSSPEVRARPESTLWVPLADPMFGPLARELERRGRGTIRVAAQGAEVTTRGKVRVDADMEI